MVGLRVGRRRTTDSDERRSTPVDRSLVPRAPAAIHDGHPAAGGLFGLAELIGASPYRLGRAFPRDLGVWVTRYRNRVRVGRALDRRHRDDASLAEIAACLGFADQATSPACCEITSARRPRCCGERPPRSAAARFIGMSAGSRRETHPNNTPGVPMVFPVWFENLQVKYLNSLIKPFARFMPGLSTIKHRGRTSGKPYETIVTAYRHGNVLAIALAHGNTAWVKNVLAAGEADLHFIRRDVHLVNPRVVPAGGNADGLPFMARMQVRRMAVFVADIA
jgi:deazaflavin-dependent oxidoreductase (nitroreductase family)